MILDPVTPIQGVDDLVERDFGIQRYKNVFNTRNVKKSYPFEGSDEDNLDPGSHFNRDRKEESATRYFLRDRREKNKTNLRNSFEQFFRTDRDTESKPIAARDPNPDHSEMYFLRNRRVDPISSLPVAFYRNANLYKIH